MAAGYGTRADSEGVHRLRDGRLLAYAEFGDPRGKPVFYFHGLPGSRLEGRLLDRTARQGNLRVIAPDRPGFGRSDFKADRTIADWPGDVTELADTLGLETFAVVGNSGGSPYAAACARYLGPRLTGTTLVCGLGPVSAAGDLAEMASWIRLVFGLARRPSFLLPPLVGLIASCLRHFPEQALTFMALKGAAPDRQVLREPMVREVLKASFREAGRQGGRGGVLEMQLFTRPWGFRLEDISSEIQLWFGGLDRTVPPRMGEAQAAALPNCRRRYYPEEGHFSLPVRHIREILAEVR
ncbi:MAG: alpha/beta hydrolase [Desulfurivibrionaceae bacterium]|nr:alpha/beta hydrolase [Desulfurivibrionaceae bacterium]